MLYDCVYDCLRLFTGSVSEHRDLFPASQESGEDRLHVDVYLFTCCTIVFTIVYDCLQVQSQNTVTCSQLHKRVERIGCMLMYICLRLCLRLFTGSVSEHRDLFPASQESGEDRLHVDVYLFTLCTFVFTIVFTIVYRFSLRTLTSSHVDVYLFTFCTIVFTFVFTIVFTIVYRFSLRTP